MTPEEVRYQILSRIETRPNLNQRELSRELGVSLGKVNYCLRALVDKGFVKAGNFRRSETKVAYLYLLTPSGLDEKIRQTREFLARKREEYGLLKHQIEALTAELKAADAKDAQ